MGVKLLAKATDDGLTQRFIDRYPHLGTALTSRGADRPTVVVQTDRAVREVHQSNRIEVARNGLAERGLPLQPGLLDGAQRNAVLGVGIGALGIIDQRRGVVAIFVDDHKTLFFDGGNTLLGHIGAVVLPLLFERIDLLYIERRTGMTAWKKKVNDYAAFSAAVKQDYICAEQFLTQAEQCLGLPAAHGMMTPREAQNTRLLYFRMKEELVIAQAPELMLNRYDADIPCLIDRCTELYFFSVGAKSCGLSVYVLAPGVEDGTLTFSDVCLGYNGQLLPIALEKMQLSDGRWAYGYHDPNFSIPAGPPRRLKWEKRWQLLVQQSIVLKFVPRGDSRKTLDITVMVVPDYNPEGQIRWNVWEPWGSKSAFIDHHNKIWKRVRAFEQDESQCLPLLKKEDFDC